MVLVTTVMWFRKQKIMSYFRKTIGPFHRNIYSKPHSIHMVAVSLYLVSLLEGIFDFATLTPIYISLGEDLDTVLILKFQVLGH